MKNLIFITILLMCFQSCTQKSKDNISNLLDDDITVTEISDTVTENIILTELIVDRDSINEFLNNPFDLINFKKN